MRHTIPNSRITVWYRGGYRPWKRERDATYQHRRAASRLREALPRAAAQLATIGLIHAGSVTRRYTHCGTPGCKCHAEPPQPHGPYYQWTAKINSKTITRRPREDEAELYQPTADSDVSSNRCVRSPPKLLSSGSDKQPARNRAGLTSTRTRQPGPSSHSAKNPRTNRLPGLAPEPSSLTYACLRRKFSPVAAGFGCVCRESGLDDL